MTRRSVLLGGVALSAVGGAVAWSRNAAGAGQMTAAYTFEVSDRRLVAGAADVLAQVRVTRIARTSGPVSAHVWARVEHVIKGPPLEAVDFTVTATAAGLAEGRRSLVALGRNRDGSLVLQSGPHLPAEVPADEQQAAALRATWTTAVAEQRDPDGPPPR